MTHPPLEQILSLRDKRALITGAAAGIGKAIARRYAEAGATLHLVDINAAKLADVAAELSGLATNIQTHVLDLSDKPSIASLWASFDGNEPQILVNNAGIYPEKPVSEVDEAFYRKVMEVNLDSVFWMCQEMITRRARRGGIIINIGTIESILPFKDGLALYTTSKAGVIALTRALAKEYAKHGFRVNALLPGGIVTEGTRAVARQILQLRLGLLKVGYDFQQRLPIGRAGQPDEVARMALVLATDLASYVKGSIIPVDGGVLSA
ncbi:SDR family oxidoreductase [uncultured Meiothermus sp.]|uniref:SDR family NAD(P)-dependent oxidoreductase n=1 Tax=uncultured Meiothermus sp. TaxID=157471 RepID=UPI00263114EA|nr:SDR family oxidoreductase [uncultured Meiothermus sp.]